MATISTSLLMAILKSSSIHLPARRIRLWFGVSRIFVERYGERGELENVDEFPLTAAGLLEALENINTPF